MTNVTHKQLKQFTLDVLGAIPPDQEALRNVLIEWAGKFENDSKELAPTNKRKRQIPMDFELSPTMADNAVNYWSKRGRTDIDVNDEFGRFKAHHEAKGTIYKAWEKVWQTWYSGDICMNQKVFTPATTMATSALKRMTNTDWARGL